MMMKNLERPATTADSTWDDSHAVIHMEYEAFSDEQGNNAINQELVKAMISHLCADPSQNWKFCHHAPTFLHLKRTFAGGEVERVQGEGCVVATDEGNQVWHVNGRRRMWLQSSSSVSAVTNRLGSGTFRIELGG